MVVPAAEAASPGSVRWCKKNSDCIKRVNKRMAKRVVARAGRAPNAHLARIARCESGGNPRAISANGAYRGKYQFDFQTWASVGGRGDPAAASEAEQDRRAMMLYARRGSQPWPVCQHS